MKQKLIVTAIVVFASCSLVLPALTQTSGPCSSGTSYRGCPACGSAKSVKAQRDNLLIFTSSDMDIAKITPSAIITFLKTTFIKTRNVTGYNDLLARIEVSTVIRLLADISDRDLLQIRSCIIEIL